MYEKKKIITIACAVFAICAVLVYLICTGTTGSRNGNDAKGAVREAQEYSTKSADAVRSAGEQIKSAGEQLDRSISRVDRVQERIDENSRTIAECRDIIADSRRELNEAAELFRQIDREN